MLLPGVGAGAGAGAGIGHGVIVQDSVFSVFLSITTLG